MIDIVKNNGEILAYIIKNSYKRKKGINFFTPNKLVQQVAYMNHPKNYSIQPHIHKKNLRKIYDMCEVLIILEGVMKINFYNKKKIFLFSKIINKNDIAILVKGGHGFKMLKNCKFLEVKQGPYDTKKDKIKF